MILAQKIHTHYLRTGFLISHFYRKIIGVD
ncbi:uncharacterized protein METZ01_LOCUS476158 [marine metagenome]|uniref:Uncharacterized protein n=1 Tax=marine metagenome TaxID=408172 RepID=A0A383BTT3_9ZZZZ